MKKKFSYFNGYLKFELDLNVNLDESKKACDVCSYGGICIKLKHPFRDSTDDTKLTFQHFCGSVEIDGDCYPEKGTLEKNLPWIFSEDSPKYPIEDIIKLIKNFCSKYCISKCIDICPLKKIKNEKEI